MILKWLITKLGIAQGPPGPMGPPGRAYVVVVDASGSRLMTREEFEEKIERIKKIEWTDPYYSYGPAPSPRNASENEMTTNSCKICGAINPILPMFPRNAERPSHSLFWLCATHAKQEQMAGRAQFWNNPADLARYGGGPEQVEAERISKVRLCGE